MNRYLYICTAFCVSLVLFAMSTVAKAECYSNKGERPDLRSPAEVREDCTQELASLVTMAQGVALSSQERESFEKLKLYLKTFIALSYQDEGKFRSAMKGYRDIAYDSGWGESEPSPAHSLLLLLALRHAEWQSVQAIKNESSSLNPNGTAFLLQVLAHVDVQVYQGDLEGASETISLALKHANQLPEFYLWPDSLLVAQLVERIGHGDFIGAVSHLKAQQLNEDDKARFARLEAIALRELGDKDSALTLARLAQTRAETLKMPFLQALAKLTEAKTLLSGFPNKSEATQAIALIQEARTEISKAGVNEMFTIMLIDLEARARLINGEYEKAADLFVATVSSNSAIAQNILGRWSFRGEDLDEADVVSHISLSELVRTCLRRGCLPPEPRLCDYEGPGIACVPVQW